ncbi:hypothetical protein A8990_13229 [Paenibacillus taihuensis]|uniref:Lipoprotein n=1 Tax=Paenibacillus taihuensis TaxID=1156355 RepID=A0A3D9QXV6_9BACL|nr:hypothetical protein [Paenibacillus taihuensis]REE69632.1 hypothetical protein A8990_13229 [Paenibacillus taihuensis]
MLNKKLFVLIFLVIFVSACGIKIGTPQRQKEKLTLNDVLAALNKAEVQYVERAESQNLYDWSRQGAERHLYQLEPGYMTIYVFSNVEHRKAVQGDPCPTCSAIPPEGSYGMGNILVFYRDGSISMAQKLLSAFKPLGVEEGWDELTHPFK